MMKFKKILFLLFSLILFYGCSKQYKVPITNLEKILAVPSKMLSNYNFKPNSIISNRVQDAPQFLLKQFTQWFQKDITAYTPNESEMFIIKEAIETLPKLYKNILKKHLVGIYFVNNYSGSGLTDLILDKDKNKYCYMMFNPQVLKDGLSKSLTKKVNSCFIKNDSTIKIDINCGDKFNGFTYILLHEATHVVDAIKNITPYLVPWAKDLKNTPTTTPFIDNIWESYFKPTSSNDYSFREDITFYGARKGPKINITDAKNLYEQLGNTSFASIYASDSWAEDLAELFTFYHLTHKIKTPFIISILENNKVIFTYEPMRNNLVNSRFSFMTKFYE